MTTLHPPPTLPDTSAPAAIDDPLTRQPVRPQSHPWRWLAVAVVLVLAAQAVHGLAANPFYQWDRFAYWFARPVLLRGLVVTLEVTAASAALGLVGGVVLAAMRLSHSPILRAAAWLYVWLFRSVPLIVLLLVLFNLAALYPRLGLGVPFGPQFVSASTSQLLGYEAIAVLGLSLNEAAFAAEVVRSGIVSVDAGQLEAAEALGLSRWRQLRRIVFPQALRSIVPNYVNQLIGLVKATSLVFYVSLLDLFGAVQTMQSSYPGDVIPLLLVATTWYLVLTSLLSVVQYYVERYFARGAVRRLPPTPRQRLTAAVRATRARFRAEVAL